MTDASAVPVGMGAAGGAGELVFDYQLQERLSLIDVPESRHLERWVVSVSLGANPGDLADEVGFVHVLVINLEAGRDITELVDTVSGQWVDTPGTSTGPGGERHAGRAAGAPGESHARGAARHGDASPVHTLVLDRVWVEPRYRGHGFGPLMAAVALARLARGCDVAACYPAPFAGERRPQDRSGEIAALGRIWAKVGFVPWRDGVWMLDLRSTDFQATVTGLRTP